LYDDLEVRPRLARGSVLPSYAPTGTRSLEPTYEDVDMMRLLEEAALAGGLGGAVGAGAGRGGMAAPLPPEPMSPFTEIDLGGGRKVTVGGRTYGDLADTMSVTEAPSGRVGIGLNVRTSPEVHDGRWLYQPWARDVISGKRPFPTEGVEEAFKVISLEAEPERLRVVSSRLAPGSGITHGQETGFTAYFRALQEAQKRGLGFASDTSLTPMSRRVYEKLQEKGVPFVEREGGGFRVPANELGKVDLDEIMASGGPASIAHAAERTVRPSRMSRFGSALKSGAKGALSPVSIAMDLLLGSAVGAGSAGLGYASAAPGAGGLFTPPGPGYEGVVTSEGMERVAEAKELRNQAIRQQYIDEVNQRYGAGTLGPTARMDEIRDYLGPLR